MTVTSEPNREGTTDVTVQTTVRIRFKCKHVESVDLAHVPAGKRKAHAYGLAMNRDCSRCFKAGNEKATREFLAKKNAQELAEAEGFAQDHHLEPLTGTEKQLAWATRERYAVLSSALEATALSPAAFEARVLEPARKITRAGWWINNSDAEPDDIEELVRTALDDDFIQSENPF